MPLRQYPTGDVYLVAEAATGPAEALTPIVRAIVARHDPNTPVRRDRTLEFLSVQSTAGYRFRAAMVGTFAGLALVLALVGVFGVLAYSVQQRRREFGVRIALGASGSSVLGLVLRGAATMIAAGTLVGLGLALALSKTISAFLFGVQPIDPVTFVGVVAGPGGDGGSGRGGTGLARGTRRSGGGISQRLRRSTRLEHVEPRPRYPCGPRIGYRGRGLSGDGPLTTRPTRASA